MSHFSVVIIGENPEDQLAPFTENVAKGDKFAVFQEPDEDLKSCWNENNHEYESFDEYVRDYWGYDFDEDIGRFGLWCNPNAKWDWYQLGGRFSGFFKLKPQFDGEGVCGNKGLMGSCRNDSNLHVDKALKGQIDFEGMINDAREDARNYYLWVQSQFLNNIIPKIEKTWDEFLSDVDSKVISIDDARRMYHAQPSVLLWKNAVEVTRNIQSHHSDTIVDFVDRIYWDGLENFQISLEEYVDNAGNEAFVPFAMLNNGTWSEKGRMGWWGEVSGAMNQNDWNKYVTETILALPNNTPISLYDCHI